MMGVGDCGIIIMSVSHVKRLSEVVGELSVPSAASP